MKQWITAGGTAITRVLNMRCNVYLVETAGHFLLFDTSWRQERQQLGKNLRRICPGGPERLLLSHFHFDHVGNAAWLKKTYQTEIIAHEAEAGFFPAGRTPLPAGTNRFTRALMKLQEGRDLNWFDFEPFHADLLTNGNMDLQTFGFPASILPTPGHSPGSVSLLVDGEITLTGDALFGQVPWTIYPPFGDDPAKIVASWEILLKTPARLFLPAHGAPVSREKLEKEYRKRAKTST